MPDRIGQKFRRLLPGYAILPLIFAVTVNFTVYGGAQFLASGLPRHDIASALDNQLPFIPQFLVIYVGCYLFWIVNYILIARQDKQECYQFFTADFISRIICLIFFLAFPTTNIRPDVSGPGFWNHAMRILYTLDPPLNLFPSVHCLVSWFCYIGIRRNQAIPLWYRRCSCVSAILVFVSTLAVKQHVLIDIAGAVALAELCQRLGRVPALYRTYTHIFDGLYHALIMRTHHQRQRSQCHET
ncbi:MAG: phosphatase PAP2 family protein [Enterocloster asparagiformis]|nr:phosphatase PAP2 family protein [Enterocloster asparagiformis]